MKAPKQVQAMLALTVALGWSAAWGQNVKITPLGTHDGELCAFDRATLFEDPTGVRILYDAGKSVTGADDARLGAAHDFHKANLVQLNLGLTAVNGPAAAYAINELVQPAAVIASHVNEGATAGGKLKPTSRTAGFIHLVKGRPAYPALSGRTLEFNGKGQCVAGC